MAKQTLLELTQDILASLDSDQVNSISDTVESDQVARIIRSKYYDIVSRDTMPEQQGLFQLDASVDALKPTLMYVPSGVANIDWIQYYDANPNDGQQVSQFGSYSHGVNTDLESQSDWSTTSVTSNSIATGSKTFTVEASLTIEAGDGALITHGTYSMFGTVTSYSGTTLIVNVTDAVGSGTYTSWTIVSATGDTAPGYKYVEILPIDQFIDMTKKYNPMDSGFGSFTFTQHGNDFTFKFINDRQPKWCTIIENYYVVFDAYDNTFDDTLQASKTMVYGSKVTPFTLSDSFVPDLDDNQFPLLYNEAKALAFLELKQTPHMKAEQEIKRQWSTVQQKKAIVNKPSYFDGLASFGRMPRTGGYASSGYAPYSWMKQR